MSQFSPASLEIPYLNSRFETESPASILAWAWDKLGPAIAATSSFQSQSLPLLHMIGQAVPQMPVYFLDTGFHFPETIEYRDRITRIFGLNGKTLTPTVERNDFRRIHGALYKTNPDMCCYINKVEPLRLEKKELLGWVSGIRRDQTEARCETPILSIEASGQVKVCPMANWTSKDVWRYINRHDLPMHPLVSQGYLSIGCAPCTQPVLGGADERSGRWAGTAKTECGLHVDLVDMPEVAKRRQDE